MRNLFQKIISRSEGFAADKKITEYILPDKPLFFNEKKNDFISENNLPTDFINDNYIGNAVKPLSSENRRSEAIINTTIPVQSKQEVHEISAKDNNQKDNRLLPVTDEPFDTTKNELPNSDLSDAGMASKIAPPPATIMGKINQRNSQNRTFEKTGTETNAIKFIPVVTDDKRNSKISTIDKENREQGQSKSKETKKMEEGIPATGKRLQPEQPAQKDNMPPNSEKKTEQHNKLVIGRITVEIINPAPAPTKTKEPTMRQSHTSKSLNTAFTSINKLSFGLGQM